MSARATINLVDDKKTSLQGTVNAPVAPPVEMVTQGSTYQAPLGLPPFPSAVLTMTIQSVVVGPSQTSPIVPVQPTQIIGSPTILVNAPTWEETKQAFEEVSSAFQAMSPQHEEVKAGMQALASDIEESSHARISDVETIAQVKATL